VIGRTDLIGDPRFETVASRGEHEAEVDEIVAAWTRRHDKHEAMRLISAVGVPAGAVLDTMELHNDPSFERRGIMQVMRHPERGDFKMPAWPVRFGGEPLSVTPAPLLGQHNDEVLGDWLGLSAAEVDKLRQDGVI
jgi:crotonobetainyl-CoA:carnitine CoA-transferase CaiB-like acyl-CoA transferase